MKRAPFGKQVSEKFIDENMESNYVVSIFDYQDKRLQKHFYEELGSKEIHGFPLSSIFIDDKGRKYPFPEFEALTEEEQKKCRLCFYYLPYYHELYIGTTGSGKTTGCIEPQIRAISSQKNKPNLFISDPKGELFEHNARHLKDNGYRLFILNFKNLSFSNAWNPLEEMFNKQIELLNIGKDTELLKGNPDPKLKKMSEEFDGESYYKYKDMAFANEKELNRYLDIERYMCHSAATSLVNQFCNCVFSEAVGNDKTWVEGARGLMYGILLTMLEEASKPNGEFTKKMMTIKTVNDIFAMLRDGSEEVEIDGLKKKMKEYLSDKSVEAMNKLNTVIATASSTKKGYLSVFQSEVEKWMQGHIFQLTAETTIKLDDDDKPWAIFVATRDYDKSDNLIAGLFIDWVYRQSLQRFETAKAEGKTTRTVHFLLDEFANIPKIPDFDNKIATARSRDIWFHLFIQSYDQLDLVYGKETANIIVDNCNQQSFLGSQSQTTKERFSKECGEKTIISLEGELQGDNSKLQQARVLQISALDRIVPGEIYTKRIYSPVMKCSYIRSYQCGNYGYFKDFFDLKAYQDLVPVNLIVPDEEERTFEKVMPNSYFRKKAEQQKTAKAPKKEEQKKEAASSEDAEFDFSRFFETEDDN